MKNLCFFGLLLTLSLSVLSCGGNNEEKRINDSISAALHTPEAIKARVKVIFEETKDVPSVLTTRFAKIYKEADSLNNIYTTKFGKAACLDYNLLNGSDGDTVHVGKIDILKTDGDTAKVNVYMAESENSKFQYTLVYERNNWYLNDVDGQRKYLAGAVNAMRQKLGSK